MPLSPLSAADANTNERQNTFLNEQAHTAKIEEIKESQPHAAAAAGPAEDNVSQTFGGWFSTSFRYYDNIDNQDSLPDFLRWSWNQDLYLWYYLVYHSTHSVYFQLHNSYVDRGVGPTYNGIGADYEGPTISMAYYQLNLAPEFNEPLKCTVGRQYLFLGRGVAYSAVNDGVLLETLRADFYIKAFASKSQPRQDNVDFSRPGFDKEGGRFFAGGEISYLGIKPATIYLYGLYQKEISSENPDTPSQEFDYDSHYFGAGIAYKLFDALDLWSEAIVERGESFTDSSRTRLRHSDIEAWALLSGAKYRFEAPTHPIVETSYAYGSGDEDRTSVTNTVGGDTDGKDKNFLYFGYYLTGYALQPRLSNIHIAHVGASFKPLESWGAFENLAVGVKYFFYRKDRIAGGTSDLESTLPNRDIGEELNLFAHWKINSNILWSTQFGIFYPGDAYPETTHDHTKYLYSGLTYYF